MYRGPRYHFTLLSVAILMGLSTQAPPSTHFRPNAWIFDAPLLVRVGYSRVNNNLYFLASPLPRGSYLVHRTRPFLRYSRYTLSMSVPQRDRSARRSGIRMQREAVTESVIFIVMLTIIESLSANVSLFEINSLFHIIVKLTLITISLNLFIVWIFNQN